MVYFGASTTTVKQIAVGLEVNANWSVFPPVQPWRKQEGQVANRQ
jgi:hypothetical protein